jgi:peptidoglycan/LPS O-acetylase OafA/YrhL
MDSEPDPPEAHFSGNATPDLAPSPQRQQSREHAVSASTRILGLDGLRAFSISFVLIGHMHETRNVQLPALVESFLKAVPLAAMGVRVFFVISGFLITTLLMEEERRSGTVNLPRFYFRRTLRIFPPYYLYIGVILLAQAAAVLVVRPGDIWHALTYTTNYHRDRSWYLGHTWSLAVEEQFYILWPYLYRTLRQARARKLLISYILFAPVWRLTAAYLFPSQRLGIGESFLTTADSIATGCLLASARPLLLGNGMYRRIVDSRAYLLIPPLLPMIGLAERFAKLDWLVCISAQNVLIAVFVERVTRSERGLIPLLLNSKPVVKLGLWSYSVYLWQQPFLNPEVKDNVLTAFPLNIVLALTLAVTSYYLIERPVLGLRQRFEARLFPRRSDRATKVT